jgi:hypothetical protein
MTLDQHGSLSPLSARTSLSISSILGKQDRRPASRPFSPDQMFQAPSAGLAIALELPPQRGRGLKTHWIAAHQETAGWPVPGHGQVPQSCPATRSAYRPQSPRQDQGPQQDLQNGCRSANPERNCRRSGSRQPSLRGNHQRRQGPDFGPSSAIKASCGPLQTPSGACSPWPSACEGSARRFQASVHRRRAARSWPEFQRPPPSPSARLSPRSTPQATRQKTCRHQITQAIRRIGNQPVLRHHAPRRR